VPTRRLWSQIDIDPERVAIAAYNAGPDPQGNRVSPKLTPAALPVAPKVDLVSPAPCATLRPKKGDDAQLIWPHAVVGANSGLVTTAPAVVPANAAAVLTPFGIHQRPEVDVDSAVKVTWLPLTPARTWQAPARCTRPGRALLTHPTPTGTRSVLKDVRAMMSSLQLRLRSGRVEVAPQPRRRRTNSSWEPIRDPKLAVPRRGRSIFGSDLMDYAPPSSRTAFLVRSTSASPSSLSLMPMLAIFNLRSPLDSATPSSCGPSPYRLPLP